MNRLLRDKINQLNNNTTLPQMQKSQQEKPYRNIENKQQGKAGDYVFKRYKYERNHLVNNGIGHRAKHQPLDDYEEGTGNKENELEKYKQELQEEGNKFGVMDFGENEDDEEEILEIQDLPVTSQLTKLDKREGNLNLGNNNKGIQTQRDKNIFEIEDDEGQQQLQNQYSKSKNRDQQLESARNNHKNNSSNNSRTTNTNVNIKKQAVRKDQLKVISNARNVEEFDIKPMQLVDFDGDDDDDDEEQMQTQTQKYSKNITLTFASDEEQLNRSKDSDRNIKDSHQNLVSPVRKKTAPKSVFFAESNPQQFEIVHTKRNHNMKNQHQNQDQDQDQNQQKHKQSLIKNYNNKKVNKANENNQNKCQQKNNSFQYELKDLTEKSNPFNKIIDYSHQYEEQPEQQHLKGVKINKLPNNQNIEVEIIDRQLFVSSKIPPGIIIKCKLKRSSGIMSLMSPEYDLYLENGLQHLISAKKNVFRNRQLFYLSTKIGTYQKPIRTLMANVLHSTYWLVDEPRVIERKKISYLDILIDYKPFVAHYSRQMTVLCPPTLKTYHIGLQYDIPCIDFYWFQKNITLQLHYRYKMLKDQKSSQKNFELIDSEDQDQQEGRKYEQQKNKKKNSSSNMMSNSNKQDGKIKVNKSRQTSFNNSNEMQETSQGLRKTKKKEDNEDKYQYLKMEKTSQNIFDIEIQHPLTPLQAMAIILTRFDVQLQ